MHVAAMKGACRVIASRAHNKYIEAACSLARSRAMHQGSADPKFHDPLSGHLVDALAVLDSPDDKR